MAQSFTAKQQNWVTRFSGAVVNLMAIADELTSLTTEFNLDQYGNGAANQLTDAVVQTPLPGGDRGSGVFRRGRLRQRLGDPGHDREQPAGTRDDAAVSYLLLENGYQFELESGTGALLLEAGGVAALFLPYDFGTVLLAGYDDDPFGIDPGQTVLLPGSDSDPFAIDPGQTVLLSSAEDADPFGIDPGQTTLLITGLDSGP